MIKESFLWFGHMVVIRVKLWKKIEDYYGDERCNLTSWSLERRFSS